MNKLREITNNRKFVVIVVILLIIITLITGTYAWLTWANNSGDDTSLTLTIGRLADVTFTSGNDINTGLTPVFNYTDGESTTFAINNRGTTSDSFNYVVKLNITNIPTELSDNESLKYTLIKEDEVVAEGNFYRAANGNSIEIYEGSMTISGSQNFIFYIYIDGNMENPSSMMGTTFVGEIMVEAREGTNLVRYISNLYNNADKTIVTNNEIDYNYAEIYDTDTDETTSGGLMNDRLGGTTEDLNIGNIRYYGSNPNNYIDIGDVTQTNSNNWIEPLQQLGFPESMIPTTEEDCNTFMSCSNLVSINFFEDVATCNAQIPMLLEMVEYTKMEDFCGITPAGTPKLYRIIGLFKDVELSSGQKKDLIKIVKDKPIRIYSWDQSPENVNNGGGVNEWSQADLMKLLNPTYENEEVGGSLYWNSTSGSCYEYDSEAEEFIAIPCDFTNSGLSEEARNKIETVKWNLGGHNDSDVFSNQIYEFERGDNLVVPGVTCSGDWCNDKVERKAIWEGKVALAYPSDYGYAVDFNNCSDNLYNYDNCTGDNWMHSTITSNGLYASWLITPTSSDSYYAWNVDGGGDVGYYDVSGACGVSAVFYLDSALGISTGNGSKATPYVVG